MNDNNLEMSERRLQEIGNQLGMPILAPTTKIQVDDQSVPSTLQSNADLDGATDSQPSSKNPLLQYIVAGAIGLGAVGVPLTVLFGLGVTPTVTRPTAPEVEASTTLADRELDNLKTQSALDIQAKGEPQTVAQTPKPAPTPAPTATVAPPKPQPKPIVKASAPKPITINVQPPTVTGTPATIARPVPIPVTRAVSRPIPAPVIPLPRQTPIPVETQPIQATQSTQSVKPVVPEPSPLSFEQASALGMFGGDIDKPDSGSLAPAASDNSALTLTLPIGVNVAAHTISPYTSLSSRNSATNSTETPLSVQLDQPIQLAQGFNLPAGTIVQFGVTVNDNGGVTATSQGIFIDGTEIKVPVGAFALTASNSAALVANQRSLREGELSSADNTAAIWGAAGSLGKALADSGNNSVVNSSGLGTSVVQTNSGNVNIPGAILNGAFSPLAKAKEARANALAQELQQSSKLNEIPVRSLVRVFVAAAATVQVPIGSDPTAAAGTTQQGQSLGGGEVERSPTMIPTQPISAVSVRSPVAPTPTSNATTTQPVVVPPQPITETTQPVIAPPSPVTATTQPAFTPQLPITQPVTTPTNQATQGINTPSPIAPTKPNNIVNPQPQIAPIHTSDPAATQPTVAIPQPITIPTPLIQTPTTTTPQQIVTAPLPTTQIQPTAITQSSVLPQPTATPTAIDRAVTTPPALAPLQPTGATTNTAPIAPTKSNNILNTQSPAPIPTPIQFNSGIDTQPPLLTKPAPSPIATPAQFTEVENIQTPVTATTQPTTVETRSELIPIQFDNGGKIQPITTPNPAMAPLP
jgi:hypothetical protein